jgi:hypothetical protein
VRAGSWLVRWNLGLAFRGVFRREVAVGRGIFLPSVPGGVQADVAWTFGLALHGPFRRVPDVVIEKRYHQASAQAAWRASSAQIRACGRALGAYLDGCALRPAERLSLALAIRVWMLEQAARLVRRRLPSPRRSGR